MNSIFLLLKAIFIQFFCSFASFWRKFGGTIDKTVSKRYNNDVLFYIVIREISMKVEIFSDFAVVERLKELMGEFIGHFEWFATKSNVTVTVWFLVGAILALMAGMFGYRLTKAILAIGFACYGFTVGMALYELFVSDKKPLDNIEFLTCAIGGFLIALICIFLGKKKFTYIMFAGIFLLIFSALYKATGLMPVSLGLGLIAALMCIINVRVAVVLITSFTGSFAAIACISGFFPKSETFAITAQNNDMGLLIALGLGLLLTVVQFVSVKYFTSVED